MPSKLKQLHHIFQLIRNTPGISKKQILERLDELDSSSTVRTLERDLKTLREEFSIDITTGISAPPIGMINKKPIKKEIANKIQNKFED